MGVSVCEGAEYPGEWVLRTLRLLCGAWSFKGSFTPCVQLLRPRCGWLSESTADSTHLCGEQLHRGSAEWVP